MRRTIRSSALLALVLTLAGCATIATHEEYDDYRAVRTADEERDRLIAMQQYVEKHPDGYWAEAIQEERRSREDAIWARSSDTREGLEWYLRVYPDGQYVEQARPRLAALQTVSSRRQEEAQRQQELEAERRREAAERRRTWVTRAVQFWVGNLLSIRNYGSPIQRVARANEEFSEAFGQPPQPTCTPDYCIKHYGQLYHIPVPGATRLDRHIDVYLRLKMVRGRVERAELLLPNKGFSRWYEMENQVVVTDEDPQQRMQAINWALERIQPVIEQVASGAEQIDFVPEPIEPLQVEGGDDTETAPMAPGDEPSEAEEAEEPAQPEQPEPADDAGEGDGGDGLDELLREAAGTPEEQQQQTQPEPQPQPEAEPETLVLPISLMAFRHRNLRVVVFAAGDEDYEHGYDGIFLERIRD
ncbi:MAG TPA: hypothetical protein RMH99_24650 [Sandaracinaceae bacterium LLY-WYZ-13_1]|nr:hypothetical protein [Sandaracinaceae bacterium LLY-WYZ-13_1]